MVRLNKKQNLRISHSQEVLFFFLSLKDFPQNLYCLLIKSDDKYLVHCLYIASTGTGWSFNHFYPNTYNSVSNIRLHVWARGWESSDFMVYLTLPDICHSWNELEYWRAVNGGKDFLGEWKGFPFWKVWLLGLHSAGYALHIADNILRISQIQSCDKNRNKTIPGD